MSRSLPASVILVLSVAACGGAPSEEATGADDAELRAVSAAELAGTIACGETKHVHHDGVDTYRALSLTVKKGQSVDVWVRAPGADAKAWLTTPKGTALASSDDAEGTRDAHLVYSVKTGVSEDLCNLREVGWSP